MPRHFIIRDTRYDGHILAIHQVFDSASVCFKRLIESGAYERYIEMICITTDTYGVAASEITLYSFSKASGVLVRHVEMDTSGGRPPPIRV
jgi:hypothetical protein